MTFLRLPRSWSTVVCLVLGTLVLAVSPARAESSSEAVCEGAPQQAEAGGGWCYQADCTWEGDCWNACPAARSVVCNSGNVCEYDLPGGGGGGGGGPTCPAMDCIPDLPCGCDGQWGFCGEDSKCYL
ncbi:MULTISPECIES: hypothetical protein [Myxococcus]|uniref:hypothetical protein n=1 Tax=Myxococcus TaxID=32 RepID=UPI0013CFEDEB|nr:MULTISPECIES: hypothetical protein [Myxococcus]NVJ24342.1 hypothetical protein [Myxococcus sp. AM011]